MSTNKTIRRKHGGLTLLEIMVTMGILAIIIIPVMQSFATSIRVNARARRAMIATDVAETIMEGFSGKAYEEVYEGITRLHGAVNYSSSSDDSRYAFSTINDNFYNNGHAQEIDFPNVGTINNTGYANEDNLPQVIANAVINDATNGLLHLMTAGGATVMGRNEDRTDETDPYLSTAGPSADKLIFYGSCDTTDASIRNCNNVDIPMTAFLVYTRVQKYNYFFDVVVTFVPRAQNRGTDEHGDPIQDKYFAYDVTISVYDFTFDDFDPADPTNWPSRFGPMSESDTTTVFEGEPIARLTSGIMSHGYLRKD